MAKAKKKKEILEQIYDTQIYPLMKQVIEICKANNIPYLCDFALDDNLKCTSSRLPAGEQKEMHRAFDILVPKRSRPLVIETRDEKGNVISSEVLL